VVLKKSIFGNRVETGGGGTGQGVLENLVMKRIRDWGILGKIRCTIWDDERIDDSRKGEGEGHQPRHLLEIRKKITKTQGGRNRGEGNNGSGDASRAGLAFLKGD